jgi:uncharacterized membrane protein
MQRICLTHARTVQIANAVFVYGASLTVATETFKNNQQLLAMNRGTKACVTAGSCCM